MLGWHISVYRQITGGSYPARAKAECANALAVWQTGLRGLEWLDDLVERSEAINLGGNGYPSWFTAEAESILPRLSPTPPFARDVWLQDPDDKLTEKWHGKTFINIQAIAECPLEEWLLIEAWDES